MIITEARHGLYRHYKGAIYDVIGISTHSETGERCAVYSNVQGGGLWHRKLDDFLGVVILEDGSIVRRFQPISDEKEGSA